MQFRCISHVFRFLHLLCRSSQPPRPLFSSLSPCYCFPPPPTPLHLQLFLFAAIFTPMHHFFHVFRGRSLLSHFRFGRLYPGPRVLVRFSRREPIICPTSVIRSTIRTDVLIVASTNVPLMVERFDSGARSRDFLYIFFPRGGGVGGAGGSIGRLGRGLLRS